MNTGRHDFVAISQSNSNTGCPTNIVTTSTLVFSYLEFHKCKRKTCPEKLIQKSSRGHPDLDFS